MPFLLDGLAAGDAVVVATGDGTAAALRDAVDGDPRVHILERGDVYRARTPTAITTFRQVAEQRSGEGVAAVRVVGEVDFGATERDWLEWLRYESVINKALADWPLWGLCVFDTQAPARARPRVRAAHAHRRGDARAAGPPTPTFVPPADYLRQLPVPAEPLEATPPRLWAHDVEDFIGLRHAVAAELATVDAPRDVIEDFLLAVDEMTSNALRHGRPPVGLRLWVGGDRIVCTIADRGPGLTTRSPATARRTARTSPAAAWACGWPASCATTSTSPPTTTARASGSPSAWADSAAGLSRTGRRGRTPSSASVAVLRLAVARPDFDPCTCRSTSPTTPPRPAPEAACWWPEDRCSDGWCPAVRSALRRRAAAAPPCQAFSASMSRSSSPRSRKIPRQSAHWSTWTPLRS